MGLRRLPLEVQYVFASVCCFLPVPYALFICTSALSLSWLPTFNATGIVYVLSGLFRERQNNYPSVPLPHLELVPWSDKKNLISRADWLLISVVLRVDWTDEQYGGHDPA